MAHVGCNAGLAHLVEPLAEDAGAVVDVGFICHEGRHGEGGLIFPALLGVVLGVSVCEEARFACLLEAGVPR
jgi:hypothetical protein